MKYFTIRELCVSGSHPELVEIPKTGSGIYYNMVALIEKLLDPVREKLGQPMKVTSGYRPPRLNKAVSGSSTSSHLIGCAADLITGSGSKDNIKIIKALLSASVNWDQCIVEYPTFNTKGELMSAKWIHIGMGKSINRKQMLYYLNGVYRTLKVNTNYTFTK